MATGSVLADRYVLAAYMGGQIKQLREQRGWSQERLGRAIEMSRETVRRAESGDRLSEWGTLEVIAEALGATLFDLLPTDPSKLRPTPGEPREASATMGGELRPYLSARTSGPVLGFLAALDLVA